MTCPGGFVCNSPGVHCTGKDMMTSINGHVDVAAGTGTGIGAGSAVVYAVRVEDIGIMEVDTDNLFPWQVPHFDEAVCDDREMC